MADASMSIGVQVRSTVKGRGVLELSLVSVATPEPRPEEVIVRIEVSPTNPSDQGLLFARADMTTAEASGTADNPVVTAEISPAMMKALAGRVRHDGLLHVHAVDDPLNAQGLRVGNVRRPS